MNAELAYDAAGAAQFPRDGLPEVAILGRSNVGKSSLINNLVGRRKLARTSAWPGKTRRIHFYRLQNAAYLVDLPGFGYARVSKAERRSWRPLVESYLLGSREPLRGCILLVDLRRGPEQEELELLDWLASERIAVRLALTKSDKLSRSDASRRLAQIREQLSVPVEEITATSAKTGSGMAAPARWIQEWTGLVITKADGTPFPA
jgi:GTP-binding protein